MSLMKPVLLAGCMSCLAAPLAAQSPQPQTPSPDAPLIEPAAIEALHAMGEHLAGMDRFALEADTQMEVVLDSQQKLLSGGQVDYRVRRPDHLRIDLRTDVVARQLYYDGTSLTYVAPDQDSYAMVDEVPDTIHEVLDHLGATYGLHFPAADLFLWGTDAEPLDLITEAFAVGSPQINDEKVRHWAFRSETQDWEVWIRAEEPPLPLRISLVDRLDPARPRFTATYRWSEATGFPPDIFSYHPPDTAALVPFLTTSPAKPPEGNVKP